MHRSSVTPLEERVQHHLGEAFVLERELGGGGMARVWVAHERQLGRRVVIKVLRPELAAGVSVDRFRREILVAASLQHPHIVPVLGAGELDGLPYFLMPFVDGRLAAGALESGPLAVPEAVRILRDVARALAVAHGRGIVHRDIKPDNILLAGGAAVVADFGVAKALATARDAAAAAQGDGRGHRRAHHGGHRARHAGVHGARAGERRRRHRAGGRRVRVRRHGVRAARRRAAVRRAAGARRVRRAPGRGAARRARAARRRPRRARRPGDALPGQGPGRPPRRRRGAGPGARRPGDGQRRLRADLGRAHGDAARARHAAGPAAPPVPPRPPRGAARSCGAAWRPPRGSRCSPRRWPARSARAAATAPPSARRAW
jgi:tRNA A-37 threonylcarbamoyl transferase component Bud32